MLLSYNDINNTDIPACIQGIVVNETDYKPIPNAVIFIENANDQIVSNMAGEFVVSCKQKLPINLVVKHIEFRVNILTVTSVKDHLLIFLKRKADV